MATDFPTELSEQQVLNRAFDETLNALNVTSGSSSQTQGTAADNAPAVGNPVRSGHVYNSGAQTYASGDIADFQSDVNGNSKVVSGTLAGAAASATGVYAQGAINPATGNLAGLQTLEAAANKSGTTILAAGIMAQVDDTTPTAVTENQFGNVRMSSDRSLITTSRATTATVTSVASSASSVNLLASNTARKGAVITNDSSAVLYVKLGTTASTSSYTVTLAGSGAAPFSSYEVPFGYIGAIDGIWASATGNARVTEIA